MKKFIRSSISFMLVLLLLIVSLIESAEFVVSTKSDFKIEKKTKYLVLGHSHPECAFNDALIDNFLNLSKSGESYYYTYFKIKKIIENNPSIEVVFIEFTNNQINKSIDDWVWEDKYINNNYPTYAPFMNFFDKIILAKNNLSGYVNANSLSFKSNCKRILNQNFSYGKDIGGYLYLERDETDLLLNKGKDSHPHLEKLVVSEYNLKYFSKIIDFCKRKNKKVILIRSPLHQEYSGYSNEKTYQQIRKTHYSSIEYLDFAKFPLSNSEFGDLEHLNHKGAKIFSDWFADLLNAGILEINNKQDYIDQEINRLNQNKLKEY